MAHFAQINDSNIVTSVHVVANADCVDGNGDESEAVGIAFLQAIHGDSTTWVQTSYNRTFRKNYAGIGHTWDSTRDAFIRPQPYPSWTLNESTCIWTPPVAYPDADRYYWDEDNTQWVEV